MPDAIVERDGQVLTITLNRPERMNALSGAMLVRMYDAFIEASATGRFYPVGKRGIQRCPRSIRVVAEPAG
jgi:enoyl-CoA hydratase/carnithine racemase